MRAHQTHGLLLMQSNSLTLTEFRNEYLQKDAFDDEEFMDTFFERFSENPLSAGSV